ncbi:MULTISPECIES: hypothetical protein [Flavobacteriaceae]|nr:hypothetical protein [Muricauda sp. SP22]MDC6363968.1 hypothetical protein [Muricauda sp. SP22]
MRNTVTIEKSVGGFGFNSFEISHIPFGQFEMTNEVDSVISKKRSD